jgi:hypothetical protein
MLSSGNVRPTSGRPHGVDNRAGRAQTPMGRRKGENSLSRASEQTFWREYLDCRRRDGLASNLDESQRADGGRQGWPTCRPACETGKFADFYGCASAVGYRLVSARVCRKWAESRSYNGYQGRPGVPP